MVLLFLFGEVLSSNGIHFMLSHMHQERRKNYRFKLTVTQKYASLNNRAQFFDGVQILQEVKIPLLGKPSASPHEMTNDLKLLDVVIILSVQLSNLWNACGDWLSKVFLAATTAPQEKRVHVTCLWAPLEKYIKNNLTRVLCF